MSRRGFSKWRAMVVLTLPIIMGVGPCSSGPYILGRIPGGVLTGEVVAEPVDDWSFVAGAGACQVETRPEFPHSVTVGCFNDGKDLFVGCMRCEGKTWSSNVAKDSRARIKIGDKVYSVTMTRVVDRAGMQGPWLNRWRKMRGNDDAPPIPDGYWLYHLTSR